MSRRAVGAVAIFLTLGAGPAFGADLRLPVKAPPAVVGNPSVWSGFYAGVQAGYAFGNDNYILDPTFGGVAGINNSNIFGSRGFSGGVLAGYNLLLAQRWLVGVEADWSWQNIETRFSFGPGAGTGDFVTRQDWAGSIRGRVGYLVTPGTLVYGTAGWAWSNFQLEIAPFSVSSTIDGVQVGAGMETSISANWRARLEYLHTFYNAAPLDSSIVGLSGIKPSVGLGRVAAVYQFGSPAPADVAWPERAAAAPRWTGFYLGVSAGGAVGYADLSVPGIGDFKGFGLAGPVPSGFVGANYQFAPRWLIGAEAEIAPSVRSTDLTLGWIAELRGRFGYLLMPDTLLYATAGWIGTRVDDLVFAGVVVVPGRQINGVQLGGGIEAAFADAWSVRLDYQYAITQKIDLELPSRPDPTAATADPSGHVGRIAIVRRFTGD